tara:strand:+ start:85 stop:603 length:519 start_codon:yes stop_codon:yes gene_type:complete
MKKLLLIVLLIVGCDSPTGSGNKIGGNSNFETIYGMDESVNPTGIIGSGIWGECYDQNYYRYSPDTMSISVAFPIPNDYAIEPPYPNPFVTSINLTFSLPTESESKILIINSNNSVIKTILNESTLSAGYYSVIWDAKDEEGNQVEDGYYRVIVDFGYKECFANLHLLANFL